VIVPAVPLPLALVRPIAIRRFRPISPVSLLFFSILPTTRPFLSHSPFLRGEGGLGPGRFFLGRTVDVPSAETADGPLRLHRFSAMYSAGS